MAKHPDPDAVDPALEVLASYLDESSSVREGAAALAVLRTRYLDRFREHSDMLREHFEDEDRLRSSIAAERPAPRLERYADIELLGRGGMGVVYKAFDLSLKRWVAIKLCASAASTEHERHRFRLEAESMAAMKHPNIVKVFDVRDYEGTPYLTMELIKGGSLDQHAHRYREDQRALARLMIDIARAVHHAHQRQILHRDLKPSNILMHTEPDGSLRAHVVDFGLAKLLEHSEPVMDNAAQNDATLADGTLIGTASYMSPEQALGLPATTQSDVYGLGSIMYALLTGAAPFHGESVAETLEQVRAPEIRPAPPSAINPHVDPTLEAICMRCLAHEPGQRYASAEGLAVDLERWLGRIPTAARPLGTAGQLDLWVRRNPLGSAMVVLLMALFMLAVAAVYDETLETQATLANVASTHAVSVRNWLTRQRDLVSAWAASDGLGAQIVSQDLDALQRKVLAWEDDTDDGVHASPYQSIFVVDAATGALLARAPFMDPRDEGFNFRERDYFDGALRLAGQLHASPSYRSRVYYSISDSLYKFAVSAAVWHEDQIVGVVAASVTTSPDLGGLLPLTEDGDTAFVLLAVRDEHQIQGESESHPPSAGNLLALAHPLLASGDDPFWYDAEYERTFLARQCLGNYRDPSAVSRPEFTGPWDACWAPVVGSGPEPEFYVVYQQRASGVPSIAWISVGAILALMLLAGVARRFMRSLARHRGR